MLHDTCRLVLLLRCAVITILCADQSLLNHTPTVERSVIC